jgi:hypothetical protein
MVREIVLPRKYLERIRNEAISASREIPKKEVVGWISGEYLPEEDSIDFSEIHPLGKKIGTRAMYARIFDSLMMALYKPKFTDLCIKMRDKAFLLHKEGKRLGFGTYHSHSDKSEWSGRSNRGGDGNLFFKPAPQSANIRQLYRRAHILYIVGSDIFDARNNNFEPVDIRLPDGEYILKAQQPDF